jgi:hypothetical protein
MPQPSPVFGRYHASLKALPLWDAKVKGMVAGTPTITNHRGVHFHEAPPMFGYPLAGSTVLLCGAEEVRAVAGARRSP